MPRGCCHLVGNASGGCASLSTCGNKRCAGGYEVAASSVLRPYPGCRSIEKPLLLPGTEPRNRMDHLLNASAESAAVCGPPFRSFQQVAALHRSAKCGIAAQHCAISHACKTQFTLPRTCRPPPVTTNADRHVAVGSKSTTQQGSIASQIIKQRISKVLERPAGTRSASCPSFCRCYWDGLLFLAQVRYVRYPIRHGSS